MDWLRVSFLTLGLFSALGLLGLVADLREKNKTQYGKDFLEKLANKPNARLVGTYPTVDWVSPFTDLTNFVYAAPSNMKSKWGGQFFAVAVANYASDGVELWFVSANCNSGTQDFFFENDEQITVKRTDKVAFSNVPAWIPALCTDWSREKSASTNRRAGLR